uniref:Epidermal growth factor receptor substrate 15-like 1 n=1 Tax=Trichuris muris TaxID=70415 RepID=A0A5S6Q8C1_TRIMR
MVPTAEQIAGSSLTLYESMYHEINPSHQPCIGAQEAATFLKRSNLSKQVLIQIWNEADANRTGFLDRTAFFIALKFVALAQQGKELVSTNLTLDVGPPVISLRADHSPMAASSEDNVPWCIESEELKKYEDIFDSLNPVGGKLSGEQVKSVLFNSGLPVKVLGKIWDLSDIDRDGYLDKDEMCLALHLVYRALENDPVPSTLSPNMIPPSKHHVFRVQSSTLSRESHDRSSNFFPFNKGLLRNRAGSVASLDTSSSMERTSSSAKHPISRSLSGTPAPIVSRHSVDAGWPLNMFEWEADFRRLDVDHDGLVSGNDVKSFLLQTGVPKTTLANIWNVCDIKSTGRLNLEQFTLAMHLIERKRTDGIDPPVVLPAELVPPSCRPPHPELADAAEAGEPPFSDGMTAATPFGKEMEQIKREIEDMQIEKRELEAHIVQSEADMKVKQAEIRNLEVEFNTLEATINQLKRQKLAASQRLEELENQRMSLEKAVSDLREKVKVKEDEWDALKEEVDAACAFAKQQQEVVEAKQKDLQSLREEERHVEERIEFQRTHLSELNEQERACELDIEKLSNDVGRLKAQRKMLADQLNSEAESDLAGHLAQLLERNELFLPPLESIVPSKNSVSFDQFATPANDDYATPPAGMISDPFVNDDPFAQIGFGSQYPFEQFSAADPFQRSAGFSSAADPFNATEFQPNAQSFQARESYQPNNEFVVGGLSDFNSVNSAVSGSTFDPWNVRAAAPAEADQKRKPPPRPAAPPPNNRAATPNVMEDPFNPRQQQANVDATATFANFADFSKFA